MGTNGMGSFRVCAYRTHRGSHSTGRGYRIEQNEQRNFLTLRSKLLRYFIGNQGDRLNTLIRQQFLEVLDCTHKPLLQRRLRPPRQHILRLRNVWLALAWVILRAGSVDNLMDNSWDWAAGALEDQFVHALARARLCPRSSAASVNSARLSWRVTAVTGTMTEPILFALM